MLPGFDKIINRRGTGSEKWDRCDAIFGGEDLTPLWVADMDFRAPEEVIVALRDRAEHGIFGYTSYSSATYQSVISWFSRRYGWEIRKEWILYSPGVVPALNILIQAFTSPGDGIIIQQPVYHPFMKLVEVNERRILNNRLVLNESGSWGIDFAHFESLAEMPEARMFILCSPHNPVGRVWSRIELEKIIEICSKHNILIISDEIHCDLVFEGYEHIPLQKLAGEENKNIITCTAPSKTFNLAGIQVSNIIIPDEDRKNIMKIWLLKSGMSECSSFAPPALEAAYNHGEIWLKSLLDYIHENYILLRRHLVENAGATSVAELQGTYLAWADFRNLGLSDEELGNVFFKKAGVAPSPGITFGPEGSGFMRFNLACPRSLLLESLEKITAAFRSL